MLGNRVAVSPIVTVEPRRRKFHKPITLTIPVPQAAQKGMLNQYGGAADTPSSLRLLCNVRFYQRLMQRARDAILEGQYDEFASAFLAEYGAAP